MKREDIWRLAFGSVCYLLLLFVSMILFVAHRAEHADPYYPDIYIFHWLVWTPAFGMGILIGPAAAGILVAVVARYAFWLGPVKPLPFVAAFFASVTAWLTFRAISGFTLIAATNAPDAHVLMTFIEEGLLARIALMRTWTRDVAWIAAVLAVLAAVRYAHYRYMIRDAAESPTSGN